TGTGGSGKSSLTDELLRRIRLDTQEKLSVAVIAVDPNRRRSGGALLGDRIRMNSIDSAQIYFRSVGTRDSGSEVPPCVPHMVEVCAAAGYDLVVVETPGIGQGDAAVTGVADVSLYVMTPEFGAASQLEKIEMLDAADVVAINKFERRGAMDALRDVRRQMARNREEWGREDEMPVFGTVASRFNDDGVTALYQHLRTVLSEAGLHFGEPRLEQVRGRTSSGISVVVPAQRQRYLAEIATTVRDYHQQTAEQAEVVEALDHLRFAESALQASGAPTGDLEQLIEIRQGEMSEETGELLARYDSDASRLSGEDRPTRTSLAGTPVSRVALPRLSGDADRYRWLRAENLPGRFPFTGGSFETRRDDEDPTRMFAGEGGPERTNRRFHLLAEGQPATRLSTAFDSVTLYGADPSERPDIYGKVGTSGVSVATLDDMKALYDGFDLVDPSTSVSMTINGPAPAILAMFLNTAIDQHPELDPAEVLKRVRGTVQADILKEDQGQKTCIFSTEFALGMMADIAEWFVDHRV
ncbi:MAG: hypothetical protein KDB13_03490, partial [Microthrixaceae bacterium]|nr:hypothetical protein [Microthrixaceae bacterium]